MPVKLHAIYTIDEAIARFSGTPCFYCDNQFAVLPDAVLCFLTLGPSTAESHAPGSSTVIWKPSRIDYAPSDEYTWFPKDVRKPAGHPDRPHCVFVRPRGTSGFVYAGEAHLGSYGGPTDNSAGNREARFSLDSKLPLDVWLECGGYRGWQVEVNHREHVIPDGDLHAFRKLLAQLAEREYSHLCMTRYEEDSLTIFTNPERAWLMYLSEPSDCGLYLDDPDLGEDEQHFQCVCGISMDFPLYQTVPHSRAAEIAERFFSLGVLPSDFEWSEG